MSQEVHEKAYSIACTGAVDNIGGTNVDTYKIFAEEIIGNPGDPAVGDFNSASFIGEINNLPYLPCYYKFPTQPDYNQLKLRNSNGESISPGEAPVYGPDNVYIFKWRTWEHGKWYRVWILAVDQTGNMESLNASGIPNSLDKALFTTPILEEDELIFNAAPILSVLEGVSGEDEADADVNKAETSTAIFTFDNLTTFLGKLSKIVIHYKKSVDTIYHPFSEFKYHTDMDDVTSSTATYRKSFTIEDKPTNYDFRAIFLNPYDIPAKVGGDILQVNDSSVTFNGVPDFSEFAGVTNLEVRIGDNWSEAGGHLPGLTAYLRWDNMYNHSDIQGHPHADGIDRDTTQAQWDSISHYIIFMYKAGAAGLTPANTYPDPDEVNGEWFVVGEIPSPHDLSIGSIEYPVKCPAGASLAFWVGAATNTTKTTTEQITRGIVE